MGLQVDNKGDGVGERVGSVRRGKDSGLGAKTNRWSSIGPSMTAIK